MSTSSQQPALVVRKAGPWHQSIVLEKHFPLPVEPGIGQVLVRVVGAGLAFPDLLTAEDKHVRPLGKLPRVLGREMSGVVVRLGLGVKHLRLGDWVFGSPPSSSGAWAAFALANEANLHRFEPTNKFTPSIAAGFELNYGTSYHALVHQANVASKDVVLILGAAGGIGMAAIDICKAIGATVIACAGSSDKLAACKLAGADFLVDYSDPDKMREEVERITKGKAATLPSGVGGVDVVFDAVGGAWSEKALRCLRFQGRYLVLGFASGSSNPKDAIPRIPLNLVLLNERRVLGVLYGTWKDNNLKEDRVAMETMVEWMNKDMLKPVVKAYAVDKYKDAMDDLMKRRSVGKLVLDFDLLRARL
jgi:NADPH2:quinone reductase